MHVQSCCFGNLNLLFFAVLVAVARCRCLSSLKKPLWSGAAEPPCATTFIISHYFYSCKRPLVSRCDLRVRCLYTTLLSVFKEILSDNYAYRKLELHTISCPPKRCYVGTSDQKVSSWFDSYNRSRAVSDHPKCEDL